VREAIAAAEAACAVAMLTTEASAREADAVRDGATLCIKDAEDRATLAEREVLERVSRAEVENSTALTSLVTTPRALHRRSPSLRVSSRKSVGLMRHQRGNTRSVSMSSPFYRLGARSCASPSSALLGSGPCPRECDLQPSTIMRWSRSLPRSGQWCPLLRSRCSGVHPTTLPMRRLWESWWSSFTGWRGAARNLIGPLPRSVTFCSDCRPVGPGWPTVWKRLPGTLGGAGCTAGGRGKVGGSAIFDDAGLGIGAGRR
jgi:hypothetical protein